jgi:hypothetical protein
MGQIIYAIFLAYFSGLVCSFFLILHIRENWLMLIPKKNAFLSWAFIFAFLVDMIEDDDDKGVEDD